MLKRLFRSSRLVALPRSSAELAQALRAASQYADGDAARLEYTTAADALDRAVAHGRKADAPTRDAFAYALGRAELDLKEQMTELIELVKNDRIDVQAIERTGQETHEAMRLLGQSFHAFGESLNEWRTNMDDWRMNVDRTLESFQSSRDASIVERGELRTLYEESRTDRKQINERLQRIERAVLGDGGEKLETRD
jgi:hypothetical protein